MSEEIKSTEVTPAVVPAVPAPPAIPPLPVAPVVVSTPPTAAANSDNSTILGVSLRGIIAILLVITICAMSLLKIQVIEPLYTLGITAVAFYFGHQVGLSKKT